MKDWLFVTIALVVIMIAGIWGVRVLNNAITPINVTEVEPGIKCASMTSTNGVAISCWKI